ncbi:MAG: cyclic nucleotide-binding domain-containing protein [Actinomycetota bacterium]|nr:cyclic nucleotide-binding domain-containing protein [Actinomycetota bacterium]
MFIVQSGQVRISKRQAQGEVVLATLDRGDFFGEMSLLESLPREATARLWVRSGCSSLAVAGSSFACVGIRRSPLRCSATSAHA